jgi:arylsulfatase A-like enzyme
MPHTPLYPSEKFEGKSTYGLYGDCVEEIDWNTGRILWTLKELNIDENTFVVFTSDNGLWIEGGKRTPQNRKSRLQSGTAEPLRGYKMTTWDGGVRVPCVMRWPGKVPAERVIDEVVTIMDFMPMFAKLAGTSEAKNKLNPISGRHAFTTPDMAISATTKMKPTILPIQASLNCDIALPAHRPC